MNHGQRGQQKHQLVRNRAGREEFEIWKKLGPWAVLVPPLLGGVSKFAGSGVPDPLAVESDMT